MNTARDTISVLIHLPRMFLSADENVLDKLPTTACISYYHIKLRMIYRSVSGLATDSPCGVWGLLCNDPLYVYVYVASK